MFGDRQRGGRIAEALREIDAARERAAESHASCVAPGSEIPGRTPRPTVPSRATTGPRRAAREARRKRFAAGLRP